MKIDPNKVALHPFAAAIAYNLMGKEVEIHCGDVKSTLKFAETDYTQKNIIRGIIDDVMGDCIIVKIVKGGFAARAFMNVWSIKTIVPVEDDLYMKDLYEEEEFGLKKKR